MPLLVSNAAPVASNPAATSAILSPEQRIKRMEEIIREVNDKLAPELRALELLRQPNGRALAKRYY